MAKMLLIFLATVCFLFWLDLFCFVLPSCDKVVHQQQKVTGWKTGHGRVFTPISKENIPSHATINTVKQGIQSLIQNHHKYGKYKCSLYTPPIPMTILTNNNYIVTVTDAWFFIVGRGPGGNEVEWACQAHAGWAELLPVSEGSIQSC